MYTVDLSILEIKCDFANVPDRQTLMSVSDRFKSQKLLRPKAIINF
jgi:hypothetical protein